MPMQIIHSFEISPQEYQQRGKDNQFPLVECCPQCLYPQKLRKHGFYPRYAVFFYGHFHIPVLRLLCLSCKKTVSVLPDFLLPSFQHSLEFVLECLRSHYAGLRTGACRQLVQFYRRRFNKNLNRLEAFFRDRGERGIIPGGKVKAIKLLEMIGAFPKAETFAKRFQDHFQTSFMAV